MGSHSLEARYGVQLARSLRVIQPDSNRPRPSVRILCTGRCLPRQNFEAVSVRVGEVKTAATTAVVDLHVLL
jgi:hypothetical protein